MPLYEYQCDSCGHRFELIQKFSDPPTELCVACGGSVRKLLSAPAIQFKGSGWYITDYARKGSEPKSGESGSTGTSKAGSETSTAGASGGGSSTGGSSTGSSSGGGSSGGESSGGGSSS